MCFFRSRGTHWVSPLSNREIKEVGDIARRLGGYDEMIRLEKELRDIQATGREPKMIIVDGKRKVVGR